MDQEIKEPILEYGKLFTYADYLTWTIEERFEIIKGKLFKMSPAPSSSHQQVSFQLTLQLGAFFKKKNCKVYAAPFDVRLIDPKKNSKDDEDIRTVVQPDLSIICDAEKIDERGCLGAPDLVVEILSPGNSKKEMDIKFDLYEENGVREYWMVDYHEKVIFRYILKDSKFIGLKPIIETETIQSFIFPELKFNISELFT